MLILEILWRRDPDGDNGFPYSTCLVVDHREGAFPVASALNDCPDVIGIRIRYPDGVIAQKNDIIWALPKRLFV